MKLLLVVLFGLLLTVCNKQPSVLEQIQQSGTLIVVTRPGPTTYIENGNGERSGLEYDLIQRFADRLGVRLQLIVENDFVNILPYVTEQTAHFAAAGVTITEARRQHLRFGLRYLEVHHQLVYHRDGPTPPEQLTELTEAHPISVLAGTTQAALLKKISADYPQLTWEVVTDMTPERLLESVWQQQRPYALMDSTEVAQMQRFFPELLVAETFDVIPESWLAWAFNRDHRYDDLYVAAFTFLRELKHSGELDRLIERYYSHVADDAQFDYVDTREFYRHVEERLPPYRRHFENIAARHGLDWRFLAAVAYQESRWDAGAVSFTGVRGLMMLTEDTAAEMGIEDREDPFQSITGGALYLMHLYQRLPDSIVEPDRTWFALAAYNVGLGHVWDARKIVRQQGQNDDLWIHVKETLPLLSKYQWYSRARHGHARGYEAAAFVRNVRHYYDMLVYVEERNNPEWLETAAETKQPTETIFAVPRDPVM